MLSAISSRKATGRRTQFGNLGIVGYCLPPSHLGYSSILDSTRFGVGSSKLDSALAAPLIAFSDIVATRHSSSKLDSALAAPLIAFSDIVATRHSSSKLDSALAAPLIAFSDIVATRHSSSKLDSALAAPLIAFSDIVATRHSSSKLDSALAAPLIPATEPESHSCYPQEIPGQARDEGIKSGISGSSPQ